MELEQLDSDMLVSLDAMGLAVNYNKWIFDEFSPYLGKDIAEVGAGIGVFSKYFLDTNPVSFHAIEPSKKLFPFLKQMSDNLQKDNGTHIFTSNNYLSDNLSRLRDKVDTIIYINVLEHIENDQEELRIIHGILKKGGCVLIFVPALQWLYGSHDKVSGHFRRYYFRELKNKVQDAGFQIVKMKYFDLLGVIPWWFAFKLFKGRLTGSKSKYYDRFIVPMGRFCESIIPPIVGKNLILVARKPH